VVQKRALQAIQMLDTAIEKHFLRLAFEFCQEIIQSWKAFKFLALYTVGSTLKFILVRSNSVPCSEYGGGVFPLQRDV
jgi:hypothetical protein